MPPRDVRLAVVGAGRMGRNHLRAATLVPGIVLAGVVDADPAHAKAAAKEFGVREFPTVEALISAVDGAVIATSTSAHAKIAASLLRAGVACLVEKPLAATEQDCAVLIDAAAVGKATLLVGHIERFNPAVEAVFAENVDPAQIKKITARRMNPGSGRVTDMDVILDLMVHDLDIIRALKRQPVTSITADGPNGDHVTARLTFADGSTAMVTASRAVTALTRDLDVFTEGVHAHVDYNAKSFEIRQETPQTLQTFAGDALQAELAHFAACVRGEAAPRISGTDALETLRLAWRIQAAMKEQQP